MVESNVRLERHDPLWILTSTILFYIGMKVLLARHRLFCSTRTPLSCWVVMEIVHDGARVESIDSFLGSKDLGLMPINKLEQLRKYIFDIEIKRIQFEQVSNQKKKGKISFVRIEKTLSIQSVSRGNQLFI